MCRWTLLSIKKWYFVHPPRETLVVGETVLIKRGVSVSGAPLHSTPLCYMYMYYSVVCPGLDGVICAL